MAGTTAVRQAKNVTTCRTTVVKTARRRVLKDMNSQPRVAVVLWGRFRSDGGASATAASDGQRLGDQRRSRSGRPSASPCWAAPANTERLLVGSRGWPPDGSWARPDLVDDEQRHIDKRLITTALHPES